MKYMPTANTVHAKHTPMLDNPGKISDHRKAAAQMSNFSHPQDISYNFPLAYHAFQLWQQNSGSIPG